MSTPLPRAAGASPTKAGKSVGGPGPDSELREFRRASPFDNQELSTDPEVGALNHNRQSPSVKGDDDLSPFGGKIKAARPASKSPMELIPASERRVDRRFWPKDTRGLLELCEQGYSLQQGMQMHCKETADSLNSLADMCENTVKEMLTKVDDALLMLHKEAEKPVNVDWVPMFEELNQQIGPSIAKDVLARQETASSQLQDQISAKLSHMVDKVGGSMDVIHEAQKTEMAQLQVEIREVQKGANEFEKATRQSQEELMTKLTEQQSSLQVYIKDVIGQEVHNIAMKVTENNDKLADFEPVIAAQLSRQLTDSRAIDKKHHEQIHQIHKTLHQDLGQLFFEVAEIQKGLNLPFLQVHEIQDHYGNSREGSRARDFHTQTETVTGLEASTQTDTSLGVALATESKGKKQKKDQKKRSEVTGAHPTVAGSPAMKGLGTLGAVMAMKEKAHNLHLKNETEYQKKMHMREKLIKPQYNVADFYHQEGCSQAIARSSIFEQIVFFVILLHAFWIAVDADHNDATVLLNAHVVFQVAENAFCSFFVFEISIRFCAFRRKRTCVTDFWFVFDAILVSGMVAETWALTLIIALKDASSGADGVGDLSILRLARLVKMLRMARMARLLRVVPELMIILKGIGAALRSVWFFVLLTVIIVYVFAVAFRQITKDTEVGERYFPTVPRAMGYLLIEGMLPIYAPIVNNVSRDNPAYWPLIMSFILLASVTILNMLIGVLTEVVRHVACTEKEAMTVTHVTLQLKDVMAEFQSISDGAQSTSSGMFKRRKSNQGMVRDPGLGKLSKKSFEEFVMKPNVYRILHEVGVDPVGLVDMGEVIFEDKDKDGQGMSFDDFIDVVLDLRGSNPATIKDVKETQRILKHTMYETRSLNKKNLQQELGDFRTEVSNQLSSVFRELHRIQDAELDSDEDSDEGLQSTPSHVKSRKTRQMSSASSSFVAGFHRPSTISTVGSKPDSDEDLEIHDLDEAGDVEGLKPNPRSAKRGVLIEADLD